MRSQPFLSVLLAFAALAAATPIATANEVESRQLNGLLCPLLGTPLCGLQCRLVTGADGQCAPDR